MPWLTLRNFGRVKYLNISYIALFAIPIVAETYSFFSERVAPLAFPLSVKLLYAASLCYAIAILLYQYKCPSIIKRYESVEDYALGVYEVYARANPDRKLEIVLANLDDTQDDIRVRLLRLHEQPERQVRLLNVPTELESFVDGLYPSAVQRFLIKTWNAANASSPLVRYTSALFYIAGSLILVYLLIKRSLIVFFAIGFVL